MSILDISTITSQAQEVAELIASDLERRKKLQSTKVAEFLNKHMHPCMNPTYPDNPPYALYACVEKWEHGFMSYYREIQMADASDFEIFKNFAKDNVVRTRYHWNQQDIISIRYNGDGLGMSDIKTKISKLRWRDPDKPYTMEDYLEVPSIVVLQNVEEWPDWLIDPTTHKLQETFDCGIVFIVVNCKNPFGRSWDRVKSFMDGTQYIFG